MFPIEDVRAAGYSNATIIAGQSRDWNRPGQGEVAHWITTSEDGKPVYREHVGLTGGGWEVARTGKL